MNFIKCLRIDNAVVNQDLSLYRYWEYTSSGRTKFKIEDVDTKNVSFLLSIAPGGYRYKL